MLVTFPPYRQGLGAKVLLSILVPHSQDFDLFIRDPGLIAQAETPASRSHSCYDAIISLLRTVKNADIGLYIGPHII